MGLFLMMWARRADPSIVARLRPRIASTFLFLLLPALPPSLSRAQQLATSAEAHPPSAPAPEASSEPAFLPVYAPRSVRPQPYTFSLYDWSLLAAAATLRFLDYKTTEKCASDPADFHEEELPESLVRNKPALAAFETGTVVGNYYAYRWVARRHRKLARLGQYINIGGVGWAVAGNYAAIAEWFPHTLKSARSRQ
jgi:hypothetical protein